MDPLGEALHLLRLTGTLYCRAELTAPWAIAVPELPGLMAFQVVTSGRCTLEVEGRTWELEQGSLTLIPHGTPHRFHSGGGGPYTPLFDIPVDQVSDCYEFLDFGGGGARTSVTYGVVRFDHVAAQRLVALLPTVLHVDTWDEDTTGWLHSTLRFITREAAALRPGGETVITRLADILVVQAIRTWLDTAPEAREGWPAALRDPHLGRALNAIHRHPERPWTVASLAAVAGMSRSSFAARFTAQTGEPPLQYLTRWRMQAARTHLSTTRDPLSSVAHRYGYRSEAAFSRAFKRTYGTPPTTHRHPAGYPEAPRPRSSGDRASVS
ncbi:AraC family transcriptional regulator [Saccharothrix violaceirubra]|uniref:AraC family transcriptional regulator n=1 Tax=Saccharothrix violaceirubra TaxID=413306 RepID=UPI001620E9D6